MLTTSRSKRRMPNKRNNFSFSSSMQGFKHIPQPCDTDAQLHSHDLHDRHEGDWIRYLAPQK